jgi:hypothetical protein
MKTVEYVIQTNGACNGKWHTQGTLKSLASALRWAKSVGLDSIRIIRRETTIKETVVREGKAK